MNLIVKVNKKKQLVVLILAIFVCILVFIVVDKLMEADGAGVNYYYYLVGFIILFAYVLFFTIVAIKCCASMRTPTPIKRIVCTIKQKRLAGYKRFTTWKLLPEIH